MKSLQSRLSRAIRSSVAKSSALILALALTAAAGGVAAQDDAAGAQGDIKLNDISTSFQFFEQYLPAIGADLGLQARGTKLDPETAVGRSRVGVRREVRAADERAQAAPDVSTEKEVLIYDEQPFEVDFNGRVTSIIRRYEKFDSGASRTEDRLKVRDQNPPLAGLAVYIKFAGSPTQPPEIVSLSPDRTITQFEYNMIIEDLYMPLLYGVLPQRRVTAGEEWAISDAAGMMLCGEIDPPDLEDKHADDTKKAAKPGSRRGEEDPKGADAGKGSQPRRPPTPERRQAGAFRGSFKRVDARKAKPVAHFEIKGVVDVGEGERMEVAAEILFQFTPQPILKPAADGALQRDNQALKCPGAITEIRLRKKRTLTTPGSRMRRFLTWDYILERRLNDPNVSLPSLDAPPKSSPENSWIALSDARDQYRLTHSQQFRLSTIDPETPSVSFFHFPLIGKRLGLVPDTLGLRLSHESLRPGDLQTSLERSWTNDFHWQVNASELEQLPEAEWPGRQVYRFEAILRPTANGPLVGGPRQLFHIGYVIQFAQAATLVVEVISPNNSLPALRSEVEEMLKTFSLGPKWDSTGGGARRSPTRSDSAKKSADAEAGKTASPRTKTAPKR